MAAIISAESTARVTAPRTIAVTSFEFSCVFTACIVLSLFLTEMFLTGIKPFGQIWGWAVYRKTMEPAHKDSPHSCAKLLALLHCWRPLNPVKVKRPTGRRTRGGLQL